MSRGLGDVYKRQDEYNKRGILSSIISKVLSSYVLLCQAHCGGGQDDADDVVQEVFLELWNRMDSLDINEPTIESYLYKTTYSRALNFLKRYRKVDTSVIEDINE